MGPSVSAQWEVFVDFSNWGCWGAWLAKPFHWPSCCLGFTYTHGPKMSRLAELKPPQPKKGVRKFRQKSGKKRVKFGRNSGEIRAKSGEIRAKFGRNSGKIRAKTQKNPILPDFCPNFTRISPEFCPNLARISPEFYPIFPANFGHTFSGVTRLSHISSLQGDTGETGGAVQFRANQKSKVGFCSGQCIQASIRSVCGDGLEARNNTCKPDCG